MPSVKIPMNSPTNSTGWPELKHKPRSAYAVDVLWRDVRRNRQREALRLSAGVWKQEDHPELAQGGAAYVDQIRSEPDERFDSVLKGQHR